MAVFQTSKVQMRRGSELELPGSPTTLTPLVFTPGLDVGEIGFASDSGRLFIGHAPGIGQTNYRRSQFPYQNIEILTEGSVDTVRKFFNFMHRDVAAGGHYAALLQPGADWQDVPVDRTSGAAVPYQFPGTDVIAAVEYFLAAEYTSGATLVRDPIRQGTLRVLSVSTETTAECTDDGIGIRRLDLASPAALAADLAFGTVQFRVLRAGTIGNRYFRFQYRSDLSYSARLYFSVARPLSAALTPFGPAAITTPSTTAPGLMNTDVQDIVGAMVSGNVETNVQVTYDNGARKLNFAVPPARGFAPFMLRLSGDVSGGQTLDGNDQGLLVSLPATGVTPGIYQNPTVQVDAKGRVVSIAPGASLVPGLVVNSAKNDTAQTFNGVIAAAGSVPNQWDNVLTLSLSAQSLQRRTLTASAMIGYPVSGFPVTRFLRLTVAGVVVATAVQPWGEAQMGGQLTLTWVDTRNDRTGLVPVTLDTAYLCVNNGSANLTTAYQVYNPTIQAASYYSP